MVESNGPSRSGQTGGVRRRDHLYLCHSRGHFRSGCRRARRADASAYEVPAVRAFTPDVWKKMDLEIEWGFDKSTAGLNYSGRIEAYDGVVDRVKPLPSDAGTALKGPGQWQSAPIADGRRGVSLSLLYQGTSQYRKVWPYNGEPEDIPRTIVTVWTDSGNFSFLASDLEKGPILAPEYGFFVRSVNLQRRHRNLRTSRRRRSNCGPRRLRPGSSSRNWQPRT